MSKLKATKKLLKRNKKWAEYKNKFEHKQMRLIVSRVVMIFNEDIQIDDLYQLENKALEAEVTLKEDMFASVFSNVAKLINTSNIDWKSFAQYLWFVYQTSTYWKDVKNKKQNIFNLKNYVEQNQIKRNLYNKWLKSLDLSIPGMNDKIIKVQKEVF